VDTCRILVVRRVGVDVSLGDAWSAITVTDRYHQMISEMADVATLPSQWTKFVTQSESLTSFEQCQELSHKTEDFDV